MSRNPMHPQDVAVPDARAAARMGDLERRIEHLERNAVRLNHAQFYQTASSTTTDGMFLWDGTLLNTDPNLFVPVTHNGAANGGIQITRSGLFFVAASVMLGGNLSANVPYHIDFKVDSVLMSRWIGHTETANGYFKGFWAQPIRVEANDIVNVSSETVAATRYGDTTSRRTILTLTQLSG